MAKAIMPTCIFAISRALLCVLQHCHWAFPLPWVLFLGIYSSFPTYSTAPSTISSYIRSPFGGVSTVATRPLVHMLSMSFFSTPEFTETSSPLGPSTVMVVRFPNMESLFAASLALLAAPRFLPPFLASSSPVT